MNARTQQMYDMRHQLKMTLQEIADKFGISRERVRQIIGNTGKGFTDARNKRIWEKNKHLSTPKLAEMMGYKTNHSAGKYRNGERHEIEGGWLKIGTKYEDKVSQKLSSLGIGHELMPHRHPFDILLSNGIKIDVKTSVYRKLGKSWGYHFNTGQETRGEGYADFFICVTRDTNEFFIIPSSETRGNATPIRFMWPPKRASKFHQYHNRFDLLKRGKPQKEAVK